MGAGMSDEIQRLRAVQLQSTLDALREFLQEIADCEIVLPDEQKVTGLVDVDLGVAGLQEIDVEVPIDPEDLFDGWVQQDLQDWSARAQRLHDDLEKLWTYTELR